MLLKFKGLTSGTEQKMSRAGQPYHITKFVEIPSMNTFECFGDLGLPAVVVPTDFELSADVTGVKNVVVISGVKNK